MSRPPAWTWRDVYPGHRVITVVLPQSMARELLAAAERDRRRLGPSTIILDEADAQPEERDGEAASTPPRMAFEASLEPVAATPSLADTPPLRQAPAPRRPRAPRKPRAKAPAEATALVEAPPPPAVAPRQTRPGSRFGSIPWLRKRTGEVTAADRDAVAAAIAAGRVTKCPPAHAAGSIAAMCIDDWR